MILFGEARKCTRVVSQLRLQRLQLVDHSFGRMLQIVNHHVQKDLVIRDLAVKVRVSAAELLVLLLERHDLLLISKAFLFQLSDFVVVIAEFLSALMSPHTANFCFLARESWQSMNPLFVAK